MKLTKYLPHSLLILICFALLLACELHIPVIVAKGTEPVKIPGDFLFTEGPASDKEGNVYFTDQPNDRILRYSIDGKLETWLQPAGRANGLCFDNQNRLWACADNNNELWIIDENKAINVLFSTYKGGKLNGPNDVWIAPNGNTYFTDPFYQRPWWDRDTTQQDVMGVYLLPLNGTSPVRVVSDLKKPNGIIGKPNGKMLYVADIGDDKTWSFDIGQDGRLTNKKLFCDKGSDGMTNDERGNVYLTHKEGVYVFNSKGRQIKLISIDEPWTANACFGGKDLKTLFITSQTGFYQMLMNVKGVGSQ